MCKRLFIAVNTMKTLSIICAASAVIVNILKIVSVQGQVLQPFLPNGKKKYPQLIPTDIAVFCTHFVNYKWTILPIFLYFETIPEGRQCNVSFFIWNPDYK